jgi:G3E family GTPase
MVSGTDCKQAKLIVIEFGDCMLPSHDGQADTAAADIEKSLTVNRDGQEVQEWLDVANGCICCSVRWVGVCSTSTV